MKNKTIIWIAIIISISLIYILSFRNTNHKTEIETNKETQTPAPTTLIDSNTYSSEKLKFDYPKKLTLNENNGVINLRHSLDYKHENLCDFKDGKGYLNKFDDFNMNIEVLSENVDEYLKKTDWPGYEYASKNPVKIGDLNGYKIEEGIEGCGQTVYYLNMFKTKTLIIKRSYIPELNPINNKREEFLKIPNLIPENKADEYFLEIISSIR